MDKLEYNYRFYNLVPPDKEILTNIKNLSDPLLSLPTEEQKVYLEKNRNHIDEYFVIYLLTRGWEDAVHGKYELAKQILDCSLLSMRFYTGNSAIGINLGLDILMNLFNAECQLFHQGRETLSELERIVGILVYTTQKIQSGKSVLVSLWCAAYLSLIKGEIAKAQKRYKACLELLLPEDGNWQNLTHHEISHIADIYTYLAIVHEGRRDQSAANSYLHKSAEMLEFIGGKSVTYDRIAGIYLQHKCYRAAETFYKKTFEKYRDEENMYGEITTSNNLAAVYIFSKRYQDALDLLHNSITVLYDNTKKLKQYNIEELLTPALTNIICVYMLIDKPADALKYCDTALKVCKSADKITHFHLLQAECLIESGDVEKSETSIQNIEDRISATEDEECKRNLNEIKGHWYFEKHEYRQARKYYEMVLAYDQVHNKYNLLGSYANVGVARIHLGDFEKGIQMCKMALSFTNPLDFLKQKKIAAVYDNMGIAYRELRRFEEAEKCHQKAFEMSGSINEKASAYLGLGLIRVMKGHVSEGYEFVRKSLALYVQGKMQDRIGQVLQNISYLLIVMKKYQECSDLLHGLLEETDDPRIKAGCYTNLAVIAYETTKEPDRIMEAASEALKVYRENTLEEPLLLINIYWHLGLAHSLNNNHSLSYNFWKEALSVLESIRTGMKLGIHRAYFIDDYHRLYYSLCFTCILLDKKDETFEFAQKISSRVFTEIALALNAYPGAKNKVTDALVNKWKKYTKDERVIKQYSPRIDPIFLFLEAKEPNLHIEKALEVLGEDKALIQYLYDKTHFAILTVDVQHGIQCYLRQDFNENEFEEDVVSFIEHYLKRRRLEQPFLEKIQNELQRFYDLLIAPIEKYIVGKNTLIFVPDKGLSNAFFSALYSDGKYLIENHKIVVIPSAQLLNLFSGKEHPRLSTDSKCLVVADSENDLPEVDNEIQMISKYFKNPTIHRGTNANKQNIAQDFPKADFIYIACHVVPDPENPYLSYFRVWDGNKLGKFYAFEALGLKSNATTIFLRSCWSGTTDRLKGNEYTAMWNAFLLSGALNLVPATVNVDELAPTGIFVGTLLENIVGGKTTPEAVALAQREVIKNGGYPNEWALFNVIGKP